MPRWLDRGLVSFRRLGVLGLWLHLLASVNTGTKPRVELFHGRRTPRVGNGSQKLVQIQVTWELIKNTVAWAPSQACRIRSSLK